MKVPASELEQRLWELRRQLDLREPEWRVALVVSKVNLYYLTGSRPAGVLVIARDADAVLWVRRSYERTVAESAFPDIRPMRSFADIAANWTQRPDTVLVETEILPLAYWERLDKHLKFSEFMPLDRHLLNVRSVKSAWELEIMKAAGAAQRQLLEDEVPGMLREGMTELELATQILSRMLQLGHHGVCRLNMFDSELFAGSVCFGANSLLPNSFDGPDGIAGISPAAPLLGSRDRCLRKDELVFVDFGFGMDGYHTDKTCVYVLGHAPELAHAAQRICADIQKRAAAMLRPGAVPATVYESIIRDLPAGFATDFMGAGDQQVRFIGHGIGLHVDETPIIAAGFNEPIAENMTIALEPKKGLPGLGLVGVENTFAVTPDGGVSISGDGSGIIQV